MDCSKDPPYNTIIAMVFLKFLQIKENFMAPLWGSTVSRLQCHYKEIIYFLPLSPQELLVLIWLTSEE